MYIYSTSLILKVHTSLYHDIYQESHPFFCGPNPPISWDRARMLAASSAAARGASDMRPSDATAGMGAMKSEPLAAWRSPSLDGLDDGKIYRKAP